LAVGILGKTDGPGPRDAFQPRGDIDPVAHEIPVALLDDVADMDADAEFDGSFRRDAGVALDEAGLHFDRAVHCVDHAAELDNAAVASSLNDATMVDGYGWINQIAAQCAKPRQDTVFVRASEPGVADYIRDKDRGEFPGFAHRASSPLFRLAQRCRENSSVQQTEGNPSPLPDWPALGPVSLGRHPSLE